VLFRFDPHQTRAAVNQLAALFPAEEGRSISSLKALFHRLQLMDLEDLPPWSEGLLPEETDALCDGFHRAPSSRVLLGLVLVLLGRQDQRITEIARYFFFSMPLQEEIDWLRERWQGLNLDGMLGESLAWFCQFFREEPSDLLAYAVGLVERDRLPFDDLEERYRHTRLYRELMDHAFCRGGRLLISIRAKPANQQAADYLASGQLEKLQKFLTDYPSPKWQPHLLEQLYAREGPPDQMGSPFYKDLPQGSLWGIRKRLFEARMRTANTNQQRQAFWLNQLHRCQDWIYRAGVVHITIRPLQLLEHKDYTQVAMGADPQRIVSQVDHDHAYELNMEALLKDYFPW